MSNERGNMSIARLKDLIRERSKQGDPSLAEQRKAMDANATLFPVPGGVTVETADLGGLGAEWALPEGADDAPVLLYFHGGGYIHGSPISHRHLSARLALASRGRVLSIDYALAPEHPFPAAVHDGVKAYRWLLDHGHAPGDSAGGGLTMATLLAVRDAGLAMPAAAVLLSPWTDLTCDAGSYRTQGHLDPMITQDGIKAIAARYLDGADPRDPLASPNFADLANLPPMLIQVGSDEVLLDDARNLERAARVDAELEIWDGMIHVWQMFYQMLPEGGEAIDRLGQYLASRWKTMRTAGAI